MFPCDGSFPAAAVGTRNIEAAKVLLSQHGFPRAAADVGGTSSRRVVFDFRSGRIEVIKSQPTPAPATQDGSQARG
jgi:chemotaxis receptor (MCP) glutamine deamidase CheD